MRKILDCTSPVLRKKSRPVGKITKETVQLVHELIETMKHAKPKGVGLAAPQIGEMVRIIVINFEGNNIVMVNPEIVSGEGSAVYKEGCLSVPGLWAEVKRHAKVKYRCVNMKGKTVESEAEGMFARVLQHEIDHLDGILFIDYLQPGQEIELDEEYPLPKDLADRLLKGSK